MAQWYVELVRFLNKCYIYVETNEGYNLVLMTINVSISTEYVSSGVVKQSKLNSQLQIVLSYR
jgi:hypothetical protein